MNDVNLSKIWWVWVPVALLVFEIIFERTFPPHIVTWFISEEGPIELGQAFVAFIGLLFAARILLKLDFKTQKYLCLWVGIGALACLYITGEELSWGQQLLHWTTPAEWAQLNDQDETNLHNTSSWLDQKPRILLEIGVLVGGLVIPLARRYKPKWVPAKFSIVYPIDQLMIVTLIALGVKIANALHHLDRNILPFERGSEIEEIYLYYFVAVYMAMLYRRIVQNQR